MDKVKAIVIDDEINAIEVIQAQIKRHFPNIDVVATCQDSRLAKGIIDQFQPDLIFLDIEMPVLSGFDLLASIPKRNFETIFITAYDNYAIKAFQESAIGYILKPVDRKEFIKTVSIAVIRIVNKSYSKIEEDILTREQPEIKIQLPGNKSQVIVNLSDILYAKASGSYCEVVTINRTFLISKNLKFVISEILQNRLLKVNRSFVINPNFISEFSKKSNGQIVLSDGTRVSISEKNKDNVLNTISKQFED